MFTRKGMLATAGAIAVLLASVFGTEATSAETQRYTGTIAFLRSAAGTQSRWPSLYVVRADGSGLRRLTPEGGAAVTYRWSPDGKLIAYLDQRFSLWLVRPDGTGRRVLLPTSKMSTMWGLSWSPDSKDIAIVSPGAPHRVGDYRHFGVYVVPIDGGAPVRLPAGEHVGYSVAWSPRGDEIAYDNDGIWTIRPDGTDRRRISWTGAGPTWSSDGTQLAFNVPFHPGRHVDHYRAFAVGNADGTHLHVVTTHAYTEYGQAWSPSGRQILYGGSGRTGIYVIDSDGQNNHIVTRDSPPQTEWGALAWSPSGNSIVYDTDRTGNGDLYLVGVDGRGKVRLTNTPDTDVAPSWAPR